MANDEAATRADKNIPYSLQHDGGPARFVEIDALKVAGILTVILIHSLRAPWDPRISSTELWLGIVTRFAVPGFLFCSGFLYATTKAVGLQTVLRRMRRVLIPYLICSIGAQIWWYATGQGHAFDAIAQEILFGSSFGPFYYVFVHFFLVLFAPLFALLPSAALAGLTALAIAGQGWIESSTTLFLPIFWHIRNPILWWGYFLLGWMIRLHHDRIRNWIVARRGVSLTLLTVVIVVCTGLASSADRNEWVRAAMWLDIHAILAFIFVATCGRRSLPRPFAVLADATFAIYLLHLFFVYGAERMFQPAVNEFDLLVVSGYWCAGLFGSLAVVVLVRAIFGSRSRDIIGA